MSESIATRLGSSQPPSRNDLKLLLDSALADLTTLRASFLLLTAKLDADGGVTDTNYAATCNPAALNTTS